MDYDIRRQDLIELARTVAAGFEARAREQGTRVVLQAPPGQIDIACDRDRMIQVLENLLDNALKFSPRNTAVEVRVLPPGVVTRSVGVYGRSERGKASPIAPQVSAVVEIADVGPGVPDDQKILIFERFHQVSGSGRGRAARGVGLGLAICKEIMEAHSGWVAVRNNEGAGSVFSVGLPAREVAEDRIERRDDGRKEESVVA
jgi:signal transduction histidine kinase